MRHVSSQELQRNIGQVQDMALQEPVSITRHGRERLVLLSAEEYQRLKNRDKQALAVEEIPDWLAREIGEAEMDARFQHLDSLMD
ncbi:MAG: type II toxin-antitoxin system Phd/YefM family antitoxin [Rhodospirillales bacterium]|nr:type II toxin-antitoxin system Phd/YefM family antitoxin [Rhodospirillales bacterium]